MKVIDKQGLFYLGKVSDSDELLNYDSKNLTTHAVCVGMTGSGKTGLGIAMLEEAALSKIPAIIIDPKGDLGDLLLTFPSLTGEEFEPWIDEGEADRKGLTKEEYAKEVAKTWKEGLAKWGEDPERIQKLKDSVEFSIYTPASTAGIPLSILSSFAAPSKELMLDSGAVRDRVLSITSSLLGLLGINADPIKSREHILISTLIDLAWNNGVDLDIAKLIHQVQRPPFDKIGVLDMDTFFPPKDRLSLSISLNNLLASPGFQAWMEGDPLDIQELLYTQEGKPKCSILSIAHLSDSERMFFVTLLLNEYISWMRKQSGTSTLRTILYMDEIFGYFPPSAMPPSKLPMLTLLKQARAFGIGIVLSTQNPVDLDYKGLSNCGTWFIGKLQTDRDKARVVEGLDTASNGNLDCNALNKLLASTGNRTFIMHSVHENNPVLFQTRWTLCYLRGPLTLVQIAALTNRPKTENAFKPRLIETSSKPSLSKAITEYFIERNEMAKPPHYKPQVVGIGKLHYVDAKNKIDTWQEICMVAPISDDGKVANWNGAEKIAYPLQKEPLSDATFEELPVGLLQEKNYPILSKAFSEWLYQNETYKIMKAPELNLVSLEGEHEGNFRDRLAKVYLEKKESLINKIRDKYSKQISQLTDKLRKAEEKMIDKQKKASQQKTDTLISFGTTILGAIFGKKVTKGTVSSAGTSMKKAGKISKDSEDASRAEQDYTTLQLQLEDIKKQRDQEIAQLGDSSTIQVDTLVIRPKKGDIFVEQVALLWWPT